jgi:S-phase kinase-associated protein 1
MDSEKKKIKLQSSNGEVFDVDIEYIKLSELINNMIRDLGIEDDQLDKEIIPLPNINSATLKKVIEWCIYHKDDPLPSEDDDFAVLRKRNELSPWDIEFFKVDKSMIFEMVLAANFLIIPGMINVGCKIIANMIKDKTTQEIRTEFNIINDFTPEEEEIVRKENTWNYE